MPKAFFTWYKPFYNSKLLKLEVAERNFTFIYNIEHDYKSGTMRQGGQGNYGPSYMELKVRIQAQTLFDDTKKNNHADG